MKDPYSTRYAYEKIGIRLCKNCFKKKTLDEFKGSSWVCRECKKIKKEKKDPIEVPYGYVSLNYVLKVIYRSKKK